MSIFFFERLAEKRIQEAIRQGQFENLPGRGKPIIFEDDSMVPQDLRMAYKMLKNAGFIPPELQTEKEIKMPWIFWMTCRMKENVTAR